MWGNIMIPMYRLWLHGLYGLYGARCPLSPERPLNLITHSLVLCVVWGMILTMFAIAVLRNDWNANIYSCVSEINSSTTYIYGCSGNKLKRRSSDTSKRCWRNSDDDGNEVMKMRWVCAVPCTLWCSLLSGTYGACHPLSLGPNPWNGVWGRCIYKLSGSG